MHRIKLVLVIITIAFAFSCQSSKENAALSQQSEVLEQVWNHVNDHFYDPEFNGVNWDEKLNEYNSLLKYTNKSELFFELLNIMLCELNSSHCGVDLISDLDRVISPYLFSEGDIGIDIRIIDKQIVVTKVIDSLSAGKAGIKTGWIIQKIDEQTITDIERQVKYMPPYNSRNKKFHLTSAVLRHLHGKPRSKVRIAFLDENKIPVTRILVREERAIKTPLAGGLPPAFLHSESYRITDNIAYLSFNAFNLSNIDKVLDNLSNVENSNGLIIDLRGNDGGSIEAMKQLLGRFVTERIQYGTYINRNEQNDDFIEPARSFYSGKVVVMIDEMSISGAENMAGIIQNHNIGVVIGNHSPGQMLWGNGYLINDSIALSIPIYKLEYPNGYNPEDNGIKPDIEAELDQEDLIKGIDTQLNLAIEYLKSETL